MPGAPAAYKVAAFMRCLLGRATVAGELAAHAALGAPPRFDPCAAAAAGALRGAGEDEAQWSQWVAIFGTLELSRLGGFPFFEEGVFAALHAHWKPLLSIFLQACNYAKPALTLTLALALTLTLTLALTLDLTLTLTPKQACKHRLDAASTLEEGGGLRLSAQGWVSLTKTCGPKP